MMGQFKEILDNNEFVLMEGAVVEILRRSNKVVFHPSLIHTQLIYDSNGVTELSSIFKSYINIAEKYDLPFIMCAPTWRANRKNIEDSGIKKSINIDAVKFMEKLRIATGSFANKILIGGIIGPKNDCYSPDQSLSSEVAEQFHSWQINELIKGGVDFVIAETIPSVKESLGMAKAASKLNVDYIISFVISRDGTILDGTSLLDAINLIDKNVDNKPIGYAVNCAHPSFLQADDQPKEIYSRLIAFLANASSLDHCDLENSDSLCIDSIQEWGDEMLRLNQEFGIKILGGCCGTDAKHLEYLASNY